MSDTENDDQWLYGDNPDLQPENIDNISEEQLLKSPEEAEPEPAPSEEPPATPEDKQVEDDLVPSGEEPSVEPPTEKEPELTEEPEVTEEPRLTEEPELAEEPTKEAEEEEPSTTPPPPAEEPAEEAPIEKNGDGEEEDSDKDLEDDSDDDINVVIGDIKAATSYTSLNIKRGGAVLTGPGDKSKGPSVQPGKFTVEEFDQIGTINGVPATEYNLDSLEDKPWRKPGADITDYFNYGFNEDTWRAYCERQKRMRVNESGVGLAPMNPIGLPRGPIPIMNDNSKYSGNFLGTGQRITTPMGKVDGVAKMNTIQVMTADRREYSRKPGFPDMSVPPPATFEEFQPEYGFNPEPEPFYGGYEPTQDSQWGPGGNAGWTPSDIKPLTPGPAMGPPPNIHMAPPPVVVPTNLEPRREREVSPHRESREREREKDRESRSRSEKPRDRDRERSHRRERSRSRSRRHKSRSRSPGHRSHRKKKSRRHDDSD